MMSGLGGWGVAQKHCRRGDLLLGATKQTLSAFLIQRFYDLDDGSLEIEGNDIRSLNVPFVR